MAVYPNSSSAQGEAQFHAFAGFFNGRRQPPLTEKGMVQQPVKVSPFVERKATLLESQRTLPAKRAI
jgi:hypothetical protein